MTKSAGKPISCPLRWITWLVILVQVNVGVPLIATAASVLDKNSSAATNGVPSQPATAANGFVPAPSFWSGADEEQIGNCRLFAGPLLPIGQPAAADNRDLQAALTAFSKTNEADFSVLKHFLDTHPHSAWRASLLNELGMYFKQQGYFTRALGAWHEAWDLTSQTNLESSQLIADQAGADYVELAAAVGQTDALEAMLKEFKDHQFSAVTQDKVAEARQALAFMRNKPALMYTCGPQALGRIRDAAGKNIFPPEIQDARASKNGFSLDDLLHLANRIQMDYQMAYRSPGAKIIMPAVAHLKVGHYVAVVKAYRGRYLIQDPTAGNRDLWITAAALDDEGSGYYLVHNGPLPPGWKPVTTTEGQTVWGRGPATHFDTTQLKKTSIKSGGPCPTKKGMPSYTFNTMMVSLAIEDTPLGYHPTYGPDVNFTLTYNQQDDTQTEPIVCPNLGPKWTFDWLSYVEDSTGGSSADTLYRYLPGGGEDTYTYDTDTEVFNPDSDSHTRLIRNGTWPSVTSYEVDFPDGSKFIYGHSDGGSSSRKFYLTSEVDPQGNAIYINWLSGRISTITDAVVGRSTHVTINYLSSTSGSPDYYKISSVTDPFGRTATLSYSIANSSGERNLIGITDVAGNVSTFNYRTSDGFLVGMTTPYGTTAFDTGTFNDGSGAGGRWLTATDPLGQTERLEFNQSASNPYIPASYTDTSLVPSDSHLPPLQNANLVYRNSFFWSKAVMAEMGGVITPSSYTNADIYHWCHTADSGCSGVLESFKRPLESRIWYRYPGQDNTAGSGAMYVGTNSEPIYVARVLDPPAGTTSGPTQLYQYNYNGLGLLTVVTNPVGQITRFNYDPTTLIDLKEVRQDNPETQSGAMNGGDLLASYTYDSSYPRLVSTITDTSGQTTSFAYGLHGQISTITDPRSKVTTFAYDYSGHSGFLHTVTGPVSGAVATFTPDPVDRIKTITDSDNYTITNTYDNLDRVTNVSYPDSTYEQTIYSKLDPVLFKDRQGNWTGFEYDALRHMVAAEDSAGRITQYNWCACGSLESIVDPQQGVTSWARDIEGRIIQKIYPDNSTISYAYENTDSQVKDVTDTKGQTTHCDYNVDDTILRVTYPNAIIPTPSVTFAYDSKYNRVTSMVDGTGTTTYSYNAITTSPAQGAGFLNSVATAFTGDTIAYKYDELERITNRAIDSVNLGLVFDDLGRITRVINPLGIFTNNFFGTTPRLSSIVYPLNSQETDFSYYDGTDLQDHERLQTIQNKLGTYNVSKFDYQYDSVGKVNNWTRQFDSSASTFYQFKYDSVSQVVNAGLTNGTPASPGSLIQEYIYNYDALGNRIGAGVTNASPASVTAFTAAYDNLNQIIKQTPGILTNFAGSATGQGANTTKSVTINGAPAITSGNSFQGLTVASSDRPTAQVVATDNSGNRTAYTYKLNVIAFGAPTTLIYDLNGNLISSVSGSTTNAYDWDGADRLVAITHRVGAGLGTRTEFTYDGRGRRVRIVEKDATGTVTSEKRYVWDGMDICEERDASNAKLKQYFPQGMVIGSSDYYYTRDHLGSIRELIDSSGVIRARYDYDPYGKRGANQITVNPIEADFGFTGYYYHTPSGLYFAPFRAYSPDAGRWLNRDPIGERGGLNLYRAMNNNPINNIDPLGLWNLWAPWTWGVSDGIGTSLGNSLNPFDASAGWSGFSLETSSEADAAFLDGINPFGNPLASAGLYDPCDKSLQASRHIGTATGIVEGALGLGAAAFAPEEGTSIFYSGMGAKNAALALAEAGEGSTIFDTAGGELLNGLGVQNPTVWRVASWFYANTTGSEAIVVLGEGGGTAATTLGGVEAPVLAARGIQVLTW